MSAIDTYDISILRDDRAWITAETFLDYDEVFVLGPDGQRHPTMEELWEVLAGKTSAKAGTGRVASMLERLATIAPKEK